MGITYIHVKLNEGILTEVHYVVSTNSTIIYHNVCKKEEIARFNTKISVLIYLTLFSFGYYIKCWLSGLKFTKCM